MEILPHALTHVLLGIERPLCGRHAARRSVRTVAGVCDVTTYEHMDMYPQARSLRLV
jgi:hypothetical protein